MIKEKAHSDRSPVSEFTSIVITKIRSLAARFGQKLMITSFLVNRIKDLETMYNKNKCLSDSTYPEIDLSLLWQDVENLQKHAELFLIERRAAYRRLAPIRRLKKGRKKSSSPADGST
jgi:hypothetical protein